METCIKNLTIPSDPTAIADGYFLFGMDFHIDIHFYVIPYY